jgi:hypothetical protein
MHLTNVAINKNNADYEDNLDEEADDIGSKRSYQSVLEGIDLDEGSEVVEKIK